MSNPYDPYERGLGDVWDGWWFQPAPSGNVNSMVSGAASSVPGSNAAQDIRNLAAADMRSIQARLNELPTNLARLAVDGVWGSKTQARVREFQSFAGLPVTGLLDAATRTKMFSATAPWMGATSAASNKTPTSNPNQTAPGVSNYNAPPPPQTDYSSWIIYGGIALILFAALRD